MTAADGPHPRRRRRAALSPRRGGLPAPCAGIKADAAADGNEALRLFRRGAHRLIISDLAMPGLDGLGLMRTVKREAPSTRFVLLTGAANVVHRGGRAPRGRGRRAGEADSRERASTRSSTRLESSTQQAGIVAASPRIRRCWSARGGSPPRDATVLIQGESGTGKELVAQAIHAWSPRAAGAVRRRQLRRHARDAGGERAVRPRARGLHRRAHRPRRRHRAGRRRHALPRRDRRDAPGRAGQAPARPAGPVRAPARRHGDRARCDVRFIAATNRRSARPRCASGRSARTSTSA